jgi:hypothetical protein
MAPFSEVLVNQINDLEVSFKVLAKRLREAGELLESEGRPLPQELLREHALSADQFDEVKMEALKVSESIAGLPQTSELGSIRDLRSFMQSMAEVVEKQVAYRDLQRAASDVLDKVLSIAHVDGVEFAPLLQCQEKARELRSSIAETAWPNIHPDADALARGLHIFADFVKLVSSHDRLDDEEWGRLLEVVNQSLGKPLGFAASRGKLIMPRSTPPTAQVPVSVARQEAATWPEEETVPTEELAIGGVPAARLEDPAFHRGENSAPVDLAIDPPAQMPPVTDGEAATELYGNEVLVGLAPEPAGLPSPIGATSMDQLGHSPAPESSGVMTAVATFQGALDDIRYMLTLGLIDSKGVAKALSSRISAASNAAAGGDKRTAEDFLNAFISQVHAQTGKHISGAAPQLLLTDANVLLGQLQ